jgi:NCS2 family nucleobase:cation symporter-2
MRRPVNIAYGLGDRPPVAVVATAALQQSAVVLVFGFTAILLAREVGATPAQAADILGLTFLVCGATAVIQAFGARFGLGSGFLAPGSGSPIMLAPSLLAAKAGGMRLVAGMTVFAGLLTALFARMLYRMRSLLPPEVAGTVALIVGLVVGLAGIRSLLVTPDGVPPTPAAFAVAGVTLAVSGGLSVWARGLLRFACVAIGMAAGCLLAWPLGLLRAQPGFDLAAVPLMGLPSVSHVGWDFDLALVPVFAVAALAHVMKDVGLFTTLQKMNDADWVRPDPRSIAGGVTGGGLALILAGLLGAHGTTVSTTNVAIQQASGITSRIVAIGTASLCVLFACFPRVAALLSQVPAPVIAGVLVHAGALMLTNGMALATSRMLDARRNFVIGVAVLAALAAEVVPQLAGWSPPWLRPLLSATAIGALTSLGLNALLRLGVRRTVSLTVPGHPIDEEAVADFARRAGESWGARPDVVARTAELVSWCLDAIIDARLTRGDISVTLAFDEFRVDVVIVYRGAPIDLAATPPSAEELLEDEGAGARLAGHMIRRRASRATVRQRDGLTELRIVVDH